MNWTDALAARAEEAVAVAAFRDSAAVVAHYVFGGELAALIAAQRVEHGIPVALSCRALGVSQAWF